MKTFRSPARKTCYLDPGLLGGDQGVSMGKATMASWSVLTRSCAMSTVLAAVLWSGQTEVYASDPIGCADGGREGFENRTTYPVIASCGGAWDVPGAFHDTPSCAREAGNAGVNADGAGCNVEDLCAEGWHVCYGPDDLAIRTGGRGCTDAVSTSYPNHGLGNPTVSVSPGGAFFMTRTSGFGTGNCDEVVNGFPQSYNDIFGCGTMGSTPQANCSPFNRFGHNQCQALHSFDGDSGVPASAFGYTADQYAWDCFDGADGTNESRFVVKSRPEDQGGVLCCKDTDPSLPEVCDGRDNDEDTLIDETDFDGDGDLDVVGDPCTTSVGGPGVIACTGSGGWTCVSAPTEGCCLPDGTCQDLVRVACTHGSGTPQGTGSTCLPTGAAPLTCPQPCRADLDADEICDTADGCVDVDGDGYGVGAECLGPDCNDEVATCALDCVSDFDGADGNGIPDCEEADALCVDVDGDGFGLGAGCIAVDCDESTALCNTDCGDTDTDLTPDCLDTDDDGDGLDDVVEEQLGLDPRKPDSDGDGLSDHEEISIHGSDPGVSDSDGDGVGDGDEVMVHGTDPTSKDSDGDGVEDGTEIELGSLPDDASSTPALRGENASSSGCQGGPLATLLGLCIIVVRRGLRRRRT